MSTRRRVRDTRPWLHADSEDAEEWNGPFATREECLLAGGGIGDEFWIARGTPTTENILDALDVEHLVEDLNEQRVRL